MLLVIDTSTKYAGVALASDTQILQAAHWRSRQNHSVELLPTIESLLERESTSVEELTGVAVAIGPGGFSALRVGISVAKGIAWSSALPLVAVTTLEMEAFPYLTAGLPVCAVLDAGRGQVSWALFEAHESGIAQTSEEAIATRKRCFNRFPVRLFSAVKHWSCTERRSPPACRLTSNRRFPICLDRDCFRSPILAFPGFGTG